MLLTTIFLTKKNNFSIIKKNKKTILFIYSKNLFFLLFLNKKANVFYNKYTNHITVMTTNNLWKSIFSWFLNNLLSRWNILIFKKIEFSGKGYRIKKTKNKLKLNFNHSHLINYRPKKEFLKKIRKSKFIISSTNFNNLTKNLNKIIKIRFVNLYTKRGLRPARTIILKKASKKSVSL